MLIFIFLWSRSILHPSTPQNTSSATLWTDKRQREAAAMDAGDVRSRPKYSWINCWGGYGTQANAYPVKSKDPQGIAPGQADIGIPVLPTTRIGTVPQGRIVRRTLAPPSKDLPRECLARPSSISGLEGHTRHAL